MEGSVSSPYRGVERTALLFGTEPAAASRVAEMLQEIVARPQRHAAGPVKVLSLSPTRMPPRDRPWPVSLVVADLRDTAVGDRDRILTHLDGLDPQPLWMYGPTCFARIPPGEPPQSLAHKHSKWRFFNERDDEVFVANLRASLERLVHDEPEELLQNLPPGVRDYLPAFFPADDLLLDEACRQLDRWKDPTDLTQLESPLNAHLQSMKVELLTPAGGPAHVRPELRSAFLTAVAGSAYQRKRQEPQYVVPLDMLTRPENYLLEPESVPPVRLRSALLRALLLVAFARVMPWRLQTATAGAPVDPVCRVRSGTGQVEIELLMPAEELFDEKEEARLTLQKLTLKDTQTDDVILSVRTDQTSVSFLLATAAEQASS